jgi:hypothetical protein
MGSYIEEADGKYFTDFVKNPEFQKDLVKFFSGSRYGMTAEEMKELGANGLAEKFVEHMRWQDTNEMTALKDYNYVQQKGLDPEELQSFGNLMMTYDRVEGGGTGKLSGAWDYLSAFATSPSTVATVGTAGWGVGSKLATKASGKAAQLAMRQTISELVKSGVARNVVKDKVAGTVKGQALKGALASATVEGALGAGQAGLQGETREVAVEDFEYTVSNLIRDGAISATVGGALGSGVRALDTKTQRKLVDDIISRDASALARKTTSTEAAKKTLSSVDPAKVSAAADRAVTTALTLSARLDGVQLDPLDPKLVEVGNLIKKEVLSGSGDELITGAMSNGTIRSITAAIVDMTESPLLDMKPGERITSAVSRALQEGRIDTDFTKSLREKYNLSKEEMSYLYLADLSEAGRALGEASYIKRSEGKKAATAAAKATLEGTNRDLDFLANSGIESIPDAELRKKAASTYKGKDNLIYRGLQEADALRIAFMTSQLGTTAANTVTSSFNLFVDMSDQFWKDVANTTVGREAGDKVQRNWVGGQLSTIKGLSWNKGDARLFREVFFEEMPENYSQLFYEASRAEVATESTSRLAKVSRGVNVLNSSIDSVFKQATLYSSVDRQLKELADPNLGRSMGEFLQKKLPLDSLPDGVMQKAIDDARRFTFQRSYAGDKSAFGMSAQAVIDAHRKLPFVVSAGAGIPFPRYIANHLEHINDYTPIGVMTGGLNKYDDVIFGDFNKTAKDRFARQMTGASLFLLGAYTAASSGGDVSYDKIQTETGVTDLSRVAGPWLMNMYLGDLYYRWKNDLPTKDIVKNMMDISIGQTDLGINAPLLVEIAKSYEEGEVTVGLARSLGDVAATFTYPITPTRDFIAQISPENLATPYTREVFGGSLEEPEAYGEGSYLDEMLRRATRFLPDFDFAQYTQSYNGKTAIPYYSPFSSTPVGYWDPLSKQLGLQTLQKPNDLQKEISRMGLKEFELYGNKTVENPAADVVVREILGKNLPQEFFAWKDGVKHSGRFGGLTYNEIEDSDDRRFLLKEFIASRITSAKDQVSDGLEELTQTKPRVAAGYIRNLYVLSERKMVKESGDKGIYDTAVKTYTEGDFASAADYLGDAETIEEELGRRQQIMLWSNNLGDGFKGFPEMEFK